MTEECRISNTLPEVLFPPLFYCTILFFNFLSSFGEFYCFTVLAPHFGELRILASYRWLFIPNIPHVTTLLSGAQHMPRTLTARARGVCFYHLEA
jgi:hypothetical protein